VTSALEVSEALRITERRSEVRTAIDEIGGTLFELTRR
jgi:hypothetical protein